MKVAVVGAGAASVGVVHALLKSENAIRVDLISPDEGRLTRAPEFSDPRLWASHQYDALHRKIKTKVGLKFPPPRTHLGEVIQNFAVDGKGTLWKSSRFGGLTNFWSGSMFPFVERDFQGWDIGRNELAPYYRKIAELIGVSGQVDSLDRYFGDNYVTRPAIVATKLCETLVECVNERPGGTAFEAVAGKNRLAVETRRDAPESCENCGGCMYGCYRDSIFHSGKVLYPLIETGRLSHLAGAVRKIKKGTDGKFSLRVDEVDCTGYDKVFLCAGCVSTSEILMRSYGLKGHDVFVDDNELYVFPLVYLGLKGARAEREYMSLANVVLGFIPSEHEKTYAQAHIAPFPDYLVDYYFPKRVANWIRFIVNVPKARVLLGKLYINGNSASRYALRLDSSGTLSIKNVRRGMSDDHAQAVLGALRKNLKGTPFLLPPFKPMKSGTSSHYVGNLSSLQGSSVLPATGEVEPGVYVCDSTAFPVSPAQPLTFTIMANAARIADQAVG